MHKRDKKKEKEREGEEVACVLFQCLLSFCCSLARLSLEQRSIKQASRQTMANFFHRPAATHTYQELPTVLYCANTLFLVNIVRYHNNHASNSFQPHYYSDWRRQASFCIGSGSIHCRRCPLCIGQHCEIELR